MYHSARLSQTAIFGDLVAANRANSHKKNVFSALILIFCIILGFAWGVKDRCAAIIEQKVLTGLDVGTVIGIEGRLLDDPRTTKNGKGMGTLKLRKSFAKNGIESSAKGKVLVFFPEGSIPRLKEFGRGADIYVDGKFARNTDGNNVTTFDAKMFRAGSTHVIRPAPLIDQWRTSCRASLLDSFSSSQARRFGGLSLALLLGIKDNLDAELSKQYQNAGCSYILALSGMHLAIVSALLAFVLKRPFGKKLAAVIGALFIVLYVYIVGGGASLVRAEIMFLLGTAAILFELKTGAALLLAIAFLIQINFDAASGDAISFLLSYGALAGILSLGGSVSYLFKGKLPEKIGVPLSASIGAFGATMALTIGFFGELRLVGILAGLIIAPFTTVFMIGSIIYLFLSFVFPPLNVLLALLLNINYSVLQGLAAFASTAPAIKISASAPSIFAGLLLPAAVMVLYMHVKHLRLRCT
ncbi:hypothetical protein FACS1894102_2200 [Spirochaetia bacterium]|nr:hypothetical protein FACS1894102_2200 [Spirochaetia bacterium]